MADPGGELPESALASRGLKRLALAVARDRHEAEDLLQDAWLRALELPPWRRGELEPWLARVIQNLARLARRRSVRREERERAVARPERAELGAELVARAELRRELVGHVMALCDPYREALLLRYLEELPPRTIARRLELSVNTVNTRLARGLVLLRERLRARRGGRESLLAFAALARSPFARRALEGGLSMALKSKLAGAAAVLAALGLSLFVVDALGPSAPRGGDPDSSLALDGREASSQQADGELDSTVVSVERASEPLRRETPASDRERELSGLVVHPDGRPAPGVELTVLHPPARQVESRPRDRSWDETVAELRTDEDGRFRVPLEPGRVHDLELRTAGSARERLAGLYAGEELRIVLRPALRLSGNVRFELDGAPVAGAEVSVRAGVVGTTGDLWHRAVTGEDGRYELGELPHEHWNVYVAPPGYGQLFTELDPPAALPHVVQDFVVPRGATLRGRVTDGATGEPLIGARVGVRPEPAHFALTDEGGNYSLTGIAAGSDVTLIVAAPGYGCFNLRIEKFPATGMEQDFFLLPGRRARGRVVDSAGEPVAGARVLARLQPVADVHQTQRDERRAVTDEAGRFELDELRADLPHSLLVHSAGHATAVRDFPDDEWERAEIDLGDVVLRRPGRISGRVLDPAGEPMPGLYVLLTASVARTSEPDEVPTWYSEGFGAGRVLARTDARGRYAFADLPPGRYWLSAGDKGWARRAELELALSEGETPDNVDLELDPGLAIAGRVVDEAGAPLVGEAVHAVRENAPRTYSLTRSDGRFELHGLLAGEYTLQVFSDHATHEDHEWVVEAGSTDLLLTLESVEFTVLSGIVRTPEGDPLPGCTVVQRKGLERWGDGTITDREGRFRLTVAAGKPIDLRAIPSASSALGSTFAPFVDAEGRWWPRYGGELLGTRVEDGEATVVLRETPPSVPR